ncbi:hypothetical protein [Ectobacillus antri]|uniref:hypothetical protein n=1 Tax=Ectobacillus antri TaxID=2486280 RepID=UPI000F5945E3|nr:hypothetical protein [Ectobacillus antri]
MVITLALLIPVTALVTGYFTLKAVQLGLRWQIEVRSEQPPSMETPVTQVQRVVQERQEFKDTQEQIAVMNEWLNGEVR